MGFLMNLQDFYLKVGNAGVKELAARMGRSEGWLKSLIYGPRNEKTRKKMPSLSVAVQLVKKSGGVLTYEGMANPTILPLKSERSSDGILPPPLE